MSSPALNRRNCRSSCEFTSLLGIEVLPSDRIRTITLVRSCTVTPEVLAAVDELQYAALHGIMLVAPDTSPRVELPGDRESWDFGIAAGFYLDATQAPWSQHYRMYSYVTDELPKVVAANFKADFARAGIFGHSMGGHGALTIALKNPGKYKSVSAFAPICAPSQVPWGNKAFTGYLGADKAAWAQYDAVELIKSGKKFPDAIRVDQGTADKFLVEQLKPELLVAACKAAGQELDLRERKGYDHGYFFIQSFMAQHIAWHAHRLNKPA